jgi:hypothetical protein
VAHIRRPPRKGRPLSRPRVAIRNHSVTMVVSENGGSSSRSYFYGWADLDASTFQRIGVIARRAPDGSPRFNFPQRYWLDPKVSMDWSCEINAQVETLAVNILATFKSTRLPSGQHKEVAGAFAELFLCSMPEDGGCIPRQVIRSWLRTLRD